MSYTASQQKLQLTIQAKGLKSFSRFSKHADVYAVATLTDGDDKKSVVLGQTELIPSLNPVWTETFYIHYKIGMPTHFNVSIFDTAVQSSIRSSFAQRSSSTGQSSPRSSMSMMKSTSTDNEENEHKLMGSAMFEVGEILGSRGVKAKNLKRGGVVVVRINKAPRRNSGQLVVAFQGVKLRASDRSLPDPFFELSRRVDDSVGKGSDNDGWLTVFRSQIIINNVDPIWEPAVVDLDRLCDGDCDRAILMSFYDFDKNGKHKRMGWFETSVNAILKSKVGDRKRKSIQTFQLTKNKEGKDKNYGKVVVSNAYIETMDGAADDELNKSTGSLTTTVDEYEECLNITLRAKNLTKGVHHPFFEFSRMIKEETTRLTVYRSSHLKKCTSSDPQWEMVSIPMAKLCDQNHDMPITLSVCDYKKKHKMKGKVLGQCDTTVQELLELVSGDNPNEMDKLIPLTLSKKTVGKIQVMQATVDKPANLNANGNNKRAVSSTPSEHKDSYDSDNVNYNDSMTSLSMSQHSNPPTPTTPTPTFIDYLAGGCELQLCIAIDFSQSNGHYKSSSSYHHVRPDGGLNDYERAIVEVASIISKFDPDDQYPLWGFGAKIRGNQLNCFQIGTNSEANGLRDIIHTYRSFFQYPFVMSETAIATEVIDNAAKYATWEAKHKPGCNGQTYTILLVLTDGDLQQLSATKKKIEKVSDSPLSIIIIGIGDRDFSDMQILDDFVDETDNKSAARDIVQFVEFNAHRESRHDLTAAVFEEIPDQVVEYFQKNGIEPNPPLADVQVDHLQAEPFDEEDFLLELERDGRELKMSERSKRNFSERLLRQNQRFEESVAGTNTTTTPQEVPTYNNIHCKYMELLSQKWRSMSCLTSNKLLEGGRSDLFNSCRMVPSISRCRYSRRSTIG